MGKQQGPRLSIVPCELADANAYVRRFHRHHPPVVGCKFCLAVVDEGRMVRGVAIVCRPVARMLDNGLTLEINRVATDGTPNACSALYGACRRVAFALGYWRVVTYTLPGEGGASLRAAGFTLVGRAGGGSWDTPTSGRPRVDKHPTAPKLRWEVWAAEVVGKEWPTHIAIWPEADSVQATLPLEPSQHGLAGGTGKG